MVKRSEKKPKCLEKYPCWIIIVSNIISLSIYAIGAYIMYRLGIVWMIVYLGYILILQIRLMKKSCTRCYYYGKYCAFGTGKISALFFKRGNKEDIKKFAKREMCWKDMIPDFLFSLIPILIGIVLIILDFSWLIFCLIVILIILSFPGSAFIRGSLACKFCKQKEKGCPAEKLFIKRENKKNKR